MLICLNDYMFTCLHAVVGVPVGMCGLGAVIGTSGGIGSVGGAVGVGTPSGGGVVSDA